MFSGKNNPYPRNVCFLRLDKIDNAQDKTNQQKNSRHA
jgi:hypothetical protein